MRKIVILSLILILILSAFYNCFAFEIGKKDIVSIGSCETYFKYKGKPNHVEFVIYENNGKQYPAYCLNPELNGIGTGGVGNYSVNVYEKLKNVNAWRAIVNGFPYKTLAELGVQSKEEAFTATKAAVYTMMFNRNTNDYEPLDSEGAQRAYNAYLKIVNDARNCIEPFEENIQISISADTDYWMVDNEDKEFASKIYTLNTKISSGKYAIQLEGNLAEGLKLTDINNIEKNEFEIGEKFKISIPIENLINTGNFTINAETTIESKPILYGKTTIEGTQDYAISGYMYEDSKDVYKESYIENKTKLIIVKKEYGTENRLSGVKFNIFDENKNIVKENLITDKNGEIIVEKMIPGKYYISEVETLSGYNLYPELIEVEIDFNEEFTIVVNNSKTEITKIDKVEEKTEVTSQYTESVYNVENNNTIRKLPITGF
jgi:hypothetical protein